MESLPCKARVCLPSCSDVTMPFTCLLQCKGVMVVHILASAIWPFSFLNDINRCVVIWHYMYFLSGTCCWILFHAFVCIFISLFEVSKSLAWCIELFVLLSRGNAIPALSPLRFRSVGLRWVPSCLWCEDSVSRLGCQFAETSTLLVRLDFSIQGLYADHFV